MGKKPGPAFTAAQIPEADERSLGMSNLEFANHFARFVLAEFDRKLFTKKFYRELHNRFAHIAHHDIHGFYETWFTCSAERVAFLRHTLGIAEDGSRYFFPYDGTERAIQRWVREQRLLEHWSQRLAEEKRDRELRQLAALKAKYEPETPAEAPIVALAEPSPFPAAAAVLMAAPPPPTPAPEPIAATPAEPKAAPKGVTCRRCGQTWPRDPVLEVACPTCHAKIGAQCKRPSGHGAAEIHVERDLLAMETVPGYGKCPGVVTEAEATPAPTPPARPTAQAAHKGAPAPVQAPPPTPTPPAPVPAPTPAAPPARGRKGRGAAANSGQMTLPIF